LSDVRSDSPGGAEPDLPPRVYWIVVAAAVLIMFVLYWFTSAFNIPLGSA